MIRTVIVGPGRAGTALGLAMRGSGHAIVAVQARDRGAGAEAAALLEANSLPWDDPLPPADLVVVAVRDDAIAEVAEHFATRVGAIGAAVHLSGLSPLTTLDALAGAGLAVGAFHPLQTLPTPEAGAERIRGAWIGVTTEDDALRTSLHALAHDLGATPFDLADEAKAAYHAAAAAAANFPLAALAMAQDLFAAAGVPFAAARPLVRAIVENAFHMGPRHALTGPVARGDVGTVAAQLDAVGALAPHWHRAFRDLVRALAAMTGREAEFGELLE